MKKEISSWYHLGVNGKKWKTRDEYEDLFFSDYNLKKGIFSTEECLMKSLEAFKQKEILFIHLNSQQSRFYYYALKNIKVKFLEATKTTTLAQANNIYSGKIYAALQICQAENKPIFFPFGNVRFLNVNFLNLNTGYDEPYFVFIEDEDFLEAETFLLSNNIDGVVNPLRLSGDVFSSFFLSRQNKDWMSAGTTTFHNYNVEENIFEEISNNFGYPSMSEYQISFKKEQDAFERLANAYNHLNKFSNKNSREAVCPVHIFLKKYYDLESNINNWAKEVYGT